MSAALAQDPARRVAERCVVAPEGFERWLAARGWAWQALSRGEYGLTLEEAQLLHVCEDPVLWCQAFLDEPDTGEPYQFWPYQQPSIRAYDQDVIHQDGAEVGKTREITALVLWAMCTGVGYRIPNPSILVGAPQQVHLNEIIMGMEAQLGVMVDGDAGGRSPLAAMWRKPVKAPHYLARFKGPTCTRNQFGLVYFRPAGHDGEAFRGVHVNAMELMDEAAKVKASVCWTEFYRAAKPGCRLRVYSVPDGDNDTEYFRMTQRAVENLPPEQDGLRLFHWPQTLKPEPFWGKQREQEMIRRYGGRDTPGYQRNVLGLHGQQENPVWPWPLIMRNVHDVPDYRALKLRVDEQADTLAVSCERVVLQVNEDGRRSPSPEVLADHDIPLALFSQGDRDERRAELRALLREHLSAPGPGVFLAGADLGYTTDPTEIIISEEFGAELRDVCRVHTKGMPYDLQCEVIYLLDEMFGRLPTWGADLGSAGTAVVRMLTQYEQFDEARFDERLVGIQFAQKYDAVDEDGEPVQETDPRTGNEAPVRMNGKHLATELMTTRMQRSGYRMAWDAEAIGYLSNHTAREGARDRIYSKDNDHTIDARRCQLLARVLHEHQGVDVFASGVYRRAS